MLLSIDISFYTFLKFLKFQGAKFFTMTVYIYILIIKPSGQLTKYILPPFLISILVFNQTFNLTRFS